MVSVIHFLLPATYWVLFYYFCVLLELVRLLSNLQDRKGEQEGGVRKLPLIDDGRYSSREVVLYQCMGALL